MDCAVSLARCGALPVAVVLRLAVEPVEPIEPLAEPVVPVEPVVLVVLVVSFVAFRWCVPPKVPQRGQVSLDQCGGFEVQHQRAANWFRNFKCKKSH